jgi:hypothetical protein
MKRWSVLPAVARLDELFFSKLNDSVPIEHLMKKLCGFDTESTSHFLFDVASLNRHEFANSPRRAQFDFNNRNGKSKIEEISLKTSVIEKPTMRKGSRSSQTRGKNTIMVSATGQQITSRIHHNTRAIKVLIGKFSNQIANRLPDF